MKHLSAHGSASSWIGGTLMLFLFLSLERTSAFLNMRPKQKVGECPRKRLECRTVLSSSCTTDFSCKAHLKCCHFACRRICMDPYQEPCMLPSDTGHCRDNVTRWYFDSEKKQCRSFRYSGCKGNANNFLSETDCRKVCMHNVKEGQCPLSPYQMRIDCPDSCKSDRDCPEDEKCCESRCGFTCAEAWLVKTGSCPESNPMTCSKLDKPKCHQDSDCPLYEKCCSRCGMKCLGPLH